MQQGSLLQKIADRFFVSKGADIKAAGRGHYEAVFTGPNEPVWMQRNYSQFAEEAYQKNVIAHRSIALIAQAAAGVAWQVFANKKIDPNHPLNDLLKKPHPNCAGAEFFENIYAYRLISGNAYVHSIGLYDEPPKELYCLRPDRISVIPGRNSLPKAYRYHINSIKYRDFPVDSISGKSEILHIRYFHPLDDFYGLSPVEAAAYSIDQHNQSAIWNQALLQNGARPSGALIVAKDDYNGGGLSPEQFSRLKQQVDESYSNPKNAGRPLLLEGGLQWKEMSLSNKDMDFIEAKNMAAREIALVFGVPPQLLGIPGDNTYSNFQEARLALWEDTILPMLDSVKASLNNWLAPMFGDKIHLDYDKDNISALSSKRENLWHRIDSASFLTVNEKRAMLGLKPINDN